jgi:hypothetical protein
MKPTEHERFTRICRKYNLTEEQWYALLDACHHHCPGCLKPFSSTRLPCVDHDHEDGLVRGLLCTACNYAVGERHDNADWFGRIFDYLTQPPAILVIGKVYVPNSIGAHRVGQL